MAAGLPGFGLSGAFFVISALLMLPIEIVHTLRGRSSLARWAGVLWSAGIALAILAGIELTYVGLHFAVMQLSGSVAGARGSLAQPGGRTADVARTIPVLPVLGTLGLIATLTIAGKAAELWTDRRRQPIGSGGHSATPPPELRSLGERRPTPRPQFASPSVSYPPDRVPARVEVGAAGQP